MTGQRQERWQVTHAHLRVVLVAGVSALLAVLAGRPDVVVLAVPFVAVAVWSTLTRPTTVPSVRASLNRQVLREGERTTLRVRVPPVRHLDLTAVQVRPPAYVSTWPVHGSAVRSAPDRVDAPTGEHRVSVLGQRWGERETGHVLVAGASPWGAFRWGPVPVPPLPLTVLPQPAAFDTRAPAPHPRGVVGLHRSNRSAEGSEFASIREFQWGDRLKRIHWPRSLRTGTLHVTTTHADHDTHVALILDAHYDLGRSEGVGGRPSSLDLSVRAVAAVAEHFLHQGDRVSLRVLSLRTPVRVPVGTGRRHLLRILQTLATVRPGTRQESDPARLRTGLRGGTLVVMVSALVSPDAVTQAATLARSGLAVVVIDTLDEQIQPQDDEPVAVLAWRLRMIERAHEIRALQARGVPVVSWRGPGSLDVVLRGLTRRRSGGAA